jgi:hypothetical protein
MGGEGMAPIDQPTIKLMAQLNALLLMTGRVLALTYAQANLSLEQVRELHQKQNEENLKQSLIAIEDPALSDLLTAETANVIRWLQKSAELDLEKTMSRS